MLATGLILGLSGISLSAYALQLGYGLLRWHDFGLAALVFSVRGPSFPLLWVAGSRLRLPVLVTLNPQHSMAPIVWLVTIPMFLILATLGAGPFFGPWYGWLAGSPSWMPVPQGSPDVNAILAARNAALGAVLALVIGLAGGVLGGWLASGEPVTWKYDRTRTAKTDRSLTVDPKKGDEGTWR